VITIIPSSPAIWTLALLPIARASPVQDHRPPSFRCGRRDIFILPFLAAFFRMFLHHYSLIAIEVASPALSTPINPSRGLLSVTNILLPPRLFLYLGMRLFSVSLTQRPAPCDAPVTTINRRPFGHVTLGPVLLSSPGPPSPAKVMTKFLGSVLFRFHRRVEIRHSWLPFPPPDQPLTMILTHFTDAK